MGGKADLRALTEARQERGWEVAKPEKRVVHESAQKWGTVDTEDIHETSRVQVSSSLPSLMQRPALEVTSSLIQTFVS